MYSLLLLHSCGMMECKTGIIFFFAIGGFSIGLFLVSAYWYVVKRLKQMLNFTLLPQHVLISAVE